MPLTLKKRKKKQKKFLKSYQDYPPQREIDFEIELAPSAQPISESLYHMAPIKLRELKIELDDIL